MILRPASYDVIGTTGCLHHVTNLESLFDEVAQALRSGGLFAIQDYVGEREDPALLERLFAAEEAARREPTFADCSAYAVFAKRPAV